MISYELRENIAILTMDDGKRNAVNPEFVKSMHKALDQAEADKAGAVILTGRQGTFSAGFDLKEFQKGPLAAMHQIRLGFAMLIRLLSFPRPVIAACDGHGIGLGAFLLMVCDYRIGTEGDYKYSLPESRIGIDLTDLLVAIAKARISPKYLTRMAVLSEDFDTKTALDAGVFDEISDVDTLFERAEVIARGLADMPVIFGKNKKLVHKNTLHTMQENLDAITML